MFPWHRLSAEPAAAMAAAMLFAPQPLLSPAPPVHAPELGPDPPHDTLPGLLPALRAVAPHLTQAELATWISALVDPLRSADITGPRRLAGFVGQCAVESGGFRALEENLNYTAARLCQVWPGRFPSEPAARDCAHDPRRLADTVYAGRLGNRDAESGDGWQFRGRGLIQLTGRANYERFAAAMHWPVDEAVACAATPRGAALSAAWFWTANRLNGLADGWKINELTRRINGAADGASERRRLCQVALLAIGE